MKKSIAILLAAVLILSLSACNTDNLAEYKKAVEKTDQITKGQMSVEFSVNMDYDTKGLSIEDIKELNYFKDTVGSFNAIYDEEENKSIYKSYISLSGLGFDFDVYVNGNEVFVKLPVAGKYIRLNEMNSVDLIEENYEKKIISEESLKTFIEKWVGLMKEEDVFKGKDIILTTPDGEVKTTEYTITLSNEQIKTLIFEAIEIASKDESLKQFFDEYVGSNNNDIKTLEEALKHIKDNVENYEIESFKYTSLVDIDGYIVSENMNFSIKTVKDELLLKKINCNLDTKNWDINKKQSFSFPELTDENTMNTNNLEEMPDLMEDLFKNKN